MPSNNPEYQKQYIRQHYLNNKDYYKNKAKVRDATVREFNRRVLDRYKLLVGCVDCGYRENAIALQFDHVRGTKTRAVSEMLGRACSLSTIKEEVRKCEVRCANCHSIATKLRRDALSS